MQHYIPSLLLLLWLGVFVRHPTAHWQNRTLTEPKGMISTLLGQKIQFLLQNAGTNLGFHRAKPTGSL